MLLEMRCRVIRRLRAVAALGVLAALVCVAGCAVNPATGRREFTLVTADQELAIGKDGYAATLSEYGRYDDARLSAYVDSVGQRLAKVSELPGLDWHFTVLDDPTVNAFAMPGGYIYITRGILAHLQSEAQLAGVLGHEIGHVTARHSAKQITQQQLAGLGLGLAGAFSQTFRQYSGAAQQALGLLMLKYSRDDETQADALGIRYATAAGYDPREVPNTYAMLKRISEQAGSRLPIYMSTHPDPGDREARTSALAAQAVTGKSGLIVRSKPFLEHLRGIVYGDDPRQGYFEGSHYFHPQLALEMSFPAGWKTQNGKQAVSAQNAAATAGMQFSLAQNADGLSPSDYVAALKRDGRIGEARGSGESVGGWSAWVGRLVIPQQDGSTKVLIAGFVRQDAQKLYELLGQSAAPGDRDEADIFAAIRSLRALGDAPRLGAAPDRVRVAAAPAAGTFPSVIARLGGSALSLTETSILNSVAEDSSVPQGQWIKTVEAGRKR
jgi:predicted Zn-dependent protease